MKYCRNEECEPIDRREAKYCPGCGADELSVFSPRVRQAGEKVGNVLYRGLLYSATVAAGASTLISGALAVYTVSNIEELGGKIIVGGTFGFLSIAGAGLTRSGVELIRTQRSEREENERRSKSEVIFGETIFDKNEGRRS